VCAEPTRCCWNEKLALLFLMNSLIRNVNTSLAEYERAGMGLWRTVYGDTSNGVQKLLDDIYPDMGKLFKLSMLRRGALLKRLV
jgi:hypothetical protein